ncbi:deoxyribodipyrimidine photo-lyase [bacterium]|nr:deoxyribodipyrimidine photo-lyase [bacterium]
MINLKRIRKCNDIELVSGPVVYWMSRDQRVRDNWALLYSQQKALEYQIPMAVVFCLVPQFLGAGQRQYHFMIEGLKNIERDLKQLNIQFRLLQGKPEEKIPEFLKQSKSGLLVTDFDPLKIKRKWKEKVGRLLQIPVFEVDAHNIIPCWIASEKQEYAAYTIRPKIHKQLDAFLVPFPEMKKHPFLGEKEAALPIDWEIVKKNLKTETNSQLQSFFLPGETEGSKKLKQFIDKRLNHYSSTRNDPTKNAVSDLSPYLHFGQISAQKIACEIKKTNAEKNSKDDFLEELIVRRELSDNFCNYNEYYDSWRGFPDWAKRTLKEHQSDKREYLYGLEQFENGDTHDPLWNACQMEMVKKGKMHGYMRMYWAKKILEWSPTAEKAMEIAITLNDRYELDGRDSNGYTGIAWAIGGVHDRAWLERPVFGKIRYMSQKGCRSKFDVDQYIKNVNLL